MARCHNEPEFPDQGYAWTDPERFPDPIIGERVVVRPWTLDDCASVYEIVNRSREHLLPWMPWARTDHRSIAQTTNYLSGQVLKAAKPLTADGVGLAIAERSSGEVLGSTGLHDLRRDSASCEIGYWVRHDRQGEGFASEAVRIWISAIFRPQNQGGLGLRRVRIFCSADNARSTALPRRLALRQEVHQRDDYFVPHHGVTDRLGWGVLAREWDCEHHRVIAAS